jgi:segregation and condensation protein A
MIATPAQEAIATLIELAKTGEIDPWDVPVIQVIDRFLSELGLPDEIETSQGQANLPKWGQAFLWASMLVLLKADTLERLEAIEEEVIFEELESLDEEERQRALPLHLERHIRRRSSAPPLRRRRVTLPELIAQIEQMAVEIEKIPASPSVERTRPQSRREAAKAIAQLAHQENLTELASRLEQFLTFELPQIAPQQSWVDLEDLVDWWRVSPKNDEVAMGENAKTHDKVGVFWALLLLCSQSKVELSQNEFYKDLKIQLVL